MCVTAVVAIVESPLSVFPYLRTVVISSGPRGESLKHTLHTWLTSDSFGDRWGRQPFFFLSFFNFFLEGGRLVPGVVKKK